MLYFSIQLNMHSPFFFFFKQKNAFIDVSVKNTKSHNMFHLLNMISPTKNYTLSFWPLRTWQISIDLVYYLFLYLWYSITVQHFHRYGISSSILYIYIYCLKNKKKVHGDNGKSALDYLWIYFSGWFKHKQYLKFIVQWL